MFYVFIYIRICNCRIIYYCRISKQKPARGRTLFLQQDMGERLMWVLLQQHQVLGVFHKFNSNEFFTKMENFENKKRNLFKWNQRNRIADRQTVGRTDIVRNQSNGDVNAIATPREMIAFQGSCFIHIQGTMTVECTGRWLALELDVDVDVDVELHPLLGFGCDGGCGDVIFCKINQNIKWNHKGKTTYNNNRSCQHNHHHHHHPNQHQHQHHRPIQ